MVTKRSLVEGWWSFVWWKDGADEWDGVGNNGHGSCSGVVAGFGVDAGFDCGICGFGVGDGTVVGVEPEFVKKGGEGRVRSCLRPGSVLVVSFEGLGDLGKAERDVQRKLRVPQSAPIKKDTLVLSPEEVRVVAA